MTIPGQPGYGAPQQFSQQPSYTQPQYGQQPAQLPAAYAQPAVPVPQYQQGMGVAPGQFFTQQDPHVQAQQPAQPPAPPQPMSSAPAAPVDTSSFFGGAATISFAADKGYQKGTFRGGRVLGKKIVPQTKMGTNEIITWQDGTPREQMVLTLQTAERADAQDDGQRQLFIKGDGVRSCREALSAVKASDIEIGGWYYQAWVDEKPAKQTGYNPQKVFKSIYASPGAPDPLAGQLVPTPQPVASVDQYAAYAAYQQSGVVPMAPNGAPAQFIPQAQPQVPTPQPGASPEHFAQYAAQQANGAGPIAQMPQQHAATINSMYNQALQMDPQLAAQVAGQQTSAFTAAAAPDVAQMNAASQAAMMQAYQQQQQFAPQPGGQSGAGAHGVGQPPATPSASVAPGDWSPFAPA